MNENKNTPDQDFNTLLHNIADSVAQLLELRSRDLEECICRPKKEGNRLETGTKKNKIPPYNPHEKNRKIDNEIIEIVSSLSKDRPVDTNTIQSELQKKEINLTPQHLSIRLITLKKCSMIEQVRKGFYTTKDNI